MHALQLLPTADAAPEQVPTEGKASREAGATAFPSVLAGVRLSSGGENSTGKGQVVRRIAGAHAEGNGQAHPMKGKSGKWGRVGSVLGISLIGAMGPDGQEVPQSVKQNVAQSLKGGEAGGTLQLALSTQSDGRPKQVSAVKLMPVAALEDSTGAVRRVAAAQDGKPEGESHAAMRAQLLRRGLNPQSGKESAGQTAEGKKGTSQAGTNEASKGQTAKQERPNGQKVVKGQKTVPLPTGGQGTAEERTQPSRKGSTKESRGAPSRTPAGQRERMASRKGGQAPVRGGERPDAGKGGSSQKTDGRPEGQNADGKKGRGQTASGGKAGEQKVVGRKASGQSSATTLSAEKRVRMKAGQSQVAASQGQDGNVQKPEAQKQTVSSPKQKQSSQKQGGSRQELEVSPRKEARAGTTEKTGKSASQNARLSAREGVVKGGGTESGRGPEGGRPRASEGHSSRSRRGRHASGRHVQGRAEHQGGTNHQKGGQHRQGAGQNAAGQGNAGQNSQGQQGTKGGNAQAASSSLSNSGASGDSDASALRASLTRDASSTGSGTQGTDGKSTGTSGSNSSSAAKSNGRPGGGSAPPRTMPSAWLNAAKQGPLRTAELAGGWKALEMSLGEDKGTMTVRARQGQEHTAVTVGFSEARVQAQVVANARQLQDAMQAQYGTDVDLSFGDGEAGESDGQTPGDAAPDRSSSLAPGEGSAEDETAGTSSLRSRGRREWVG